MYAMEFDRSEIVSSVESEEYAGVRVIDLFEASGHQTSRPTTLEDARQKNPRSQRFLVSGVASSLMVATSRLGYAVNGAYEVVPSRYVDGYDFDLFYIASKWDDVALMSTHVARVSVLGGNPHVKPEFDIENVFRNIALFAPERR
jgi:hypothetical protein